MGQATETIMGRKKRRKKRRKKTHARTKFPSFAAQSIAFVEQPSGRFSDSHCTTARWPCMALTSIADFVHPCGIKAACQSIAHEASAHRQKLD